jgi:hypothetical protein
MPQDPESRGNGHADAESRSGGRVVRIATALGTFSVEIVNDMGPIADALTAAVELSVVECLRAQRHLASEMATVEIQRGLLDYQVVEL